MSEMFHVTVPHPSTSEQFSSKSREQSTRRKLIERPKNRYVTVVVRTVQFMGPIFGFLVYIASFASEHWIETNSLYHWGLLTKCQSEDNSTSAVVSCVYMAPSENPGYFQAAQCLACIAMVLFAFLQFHFLMIHLRFCRHLLPAIFALLLTIVLVVLLLLLGTSYNNDTRWKNMEPSLGWSFWTSVAVTVSSFMMALVMIYRGHEEHSDSEHDSQVHPAKLRVGTNMADKGVLGKHRGTQSNLEHHHQHNADDEDHQQRKWKRRLSPILERGQPHLPPLTEVAERAEETDADYCSPRRGSSASGASAASFPS